jgi:hypothetical protein
MTDETQGQRGRPRSAEVIQRDEKVLAAIKQPMTTDELVEATGEPRNLVFLSLFRLRRDGKVEASSGRPRVFTKTA